MKKKYFVSIGLALFAIVSVWAWRSALKADYSQEYEIYGASFDPSYAAYLGLDSRVVFTRMIQDFSLRYIRLSAPWDEVQRVSTTNHFDDMDWYMDEASRSGVKVVLALGQKTPRWPECRQPLWAQELSGRAPEQYGVAFDRYITAVVERYKTHPALEYWQVENEPFLPFGECATFRKEFIEKAFARVHELDPSHERISTDSGELSLWWRSSKLGDRFGSTLYRTVWHPLLGFIRYDGLIAPWWYQFRAWLHGIDVSHAMILELQAEPWVPSGKIITTLTEDEVDHVMSPERLVQTLDFARRVGFSRVYVWGIEWWYYQHDVRKDSRLIDAARTIMVSPKKGS